MSVDTVLLLLVRMLIHEQACRRHVVGGSVHFQLQLDGMQQVKLDLFRRVLVT